MFKKIIIVLCLILSLAGCSNSTKEIQKDTMYVHFFQAGKADATLIYSDDCCILIDTGEEDLFDTIQGYMTSIGKDTIDVLIITHFDKDHVGSASQIIDCYEIGTIYQSNEPKDSDEYNHYLASMQNKGIEPVTVEDSEVSFQLDGIEVIINGPEGNYSKKESNNSSLITSILYDDYKMLLMGDSMDERIEEYLKDHQDSYDLLKVPYHGHYLESLEELIEVVRPEYSVITSSSEELEDESTIELLKEYNSEVYLTRKGSIDLTVHNQKVTIKQ